MSLNRGIYLGEIYHRLLKMSLKFFFPIMKHTRKKGSFYKRVLLLPYFIIFEEKQKVNLMAMPDSDTQYYLVFTADVAIDNEIATIQLNKADLLTVRLITKILKPFAKYTYSHTELVHKSI